MLCCTAVQVCGEYDVKKSQLVVMHVEVCSTVP